MKEFITWNQFDDAVDKMVEHYKDMNEDCVSIYGPPRGGLMFAVALSHRLNLPMITSLIDRNIEGKVLIVDDIADTGGTLERTLYSKDNYVVYTMHYHQQSTVKPDFWVEDKQDKWIVYPWEKEDSNMIQDYLVGDNINA
jgi:hypoxanthine phosphoribosyltransferase